jgi:pentatricopeptide repeat protein
MQQDEAPCIGDKAVFRGESRLLDYIHACGKDKDLEGITRVHVDLLVEALIPKDVCITIALLIAYTKCGAMREAHRLFLDVHVRNVTAWNALIAGYARNHLGDEAVKCFKCMQDKGITPNAVTFICISKACASIGDIEMGHVIYAEAQKWDLLSKDIMLGNALIDMYTRFGLMQRAQEVFEKMTVKNVVTWTSLIGGYARLELATLAIECFREMLSTGCPPDTVTLFWVLKACNSIGCSELPEEIYNVVRDEKALLGADGAIGRMLVDMYSRYDAMAKT